MDDFVNGMTKVWIPVEEIARLVDGKNDPVKLALQETRIVNAHYNPTTTVRFSVCKPFQLLIELKTPC